MTDGWLAFSNGSNNGGVMVAEMGELRGADAVAFLEVVLDSRGGLFTTLLGGDEQRRELDQSVADAAAHETPVGVTQDD